MLFRWGDVSDAGREMDARWVEEAARIGCDMEEEDNCIVLRNVYGGRIVIASFAHPAPRQSGLTVYDMYANFMETTTPRADARIVALTYLANCRYTQIETVFSLATDEGLKDFFLVCMSITAVTHNPPYVCLNRDRDDTVRTRSPVLRIYRESTDRWRIAHHHTATGDFTLSHGDAHIFTTADDAILYAISQGYNSLSRYNGVHQLKGRYA